MAAPHVAGIVAQLFEAKPDATPGEVEEALKSTAHKYADGAAYEPTGRPHDLLRQGDRPRRRRRRGAGAHG